MCIDQHTHFIGDFFYGLVPRDLFEPVSHLFQGMCEAVFGVLMIADIQPFAAGIAQASGVALVRLDLNHPIVFHQHFQPAVLGTQYTPCFMPLAHL